MVSRATLDLILLIGIIFLIATLSFSFLFGRIHVYSFWMGAAVTYILVHYWYRYERYQARVAQGVYEGDFVDLKLIEVKNMLMRLRRQKDVE